MCLIFASCNRRVTNPNLIEQERLPFLEGWRTPTTQIDGRLIASDTLQLALLTPEKRSDYGARFDGNNGTLPKDFHGPGGNGSSYPGGMGGGHGGHGGSGPGGGFPGDKDHGHMKKGKYRGPHNSRRDEMED